jgi:hypothetical protein
LFLIYFASFRESVKKAHLGRGGAGGGGGVGGGGVCSSSAARAMGDKGTHAQYDAEQCFERLLPNIQHRLV